MRSCSAIREETGQGGRSPRGQRKRKMESHNVIGDIKQEEFDIATMKMIKGLQDMDSTTAARLAII